MCAPAAPSGLAGPEPRPSAQAAEIVRGAYDLHVHINPDVIERRIDDMALAQGHRERALSGFALKSHYTPTAERATLVSQLTGLDVIGAITLNAPVGGMNALAVEIAAREHARIVWFPTFDAENEPLGRTAAKPGVPVPVWAKMQHELRDQGFRPEPVRVVDEHGALLPEVHDVLRVIARHDLVLATGHLSRDEIFTLVRGAKEAGVKRIAITHPEFPSQNIGLADQRALAADGVLLERCFTTAHTGKVSWETMFENIRGVGVEHSYVSTDLGQLGNPPCEDGMALMADKMLAAGFTPQEIHTMTVVNTRKLVR
ncbi:MAG TPA: DUF6282 family protein [Candidatus Sulfotelmatobacter sp.]|nr:DUF6282 family protein [Candidatus Sulfotelmatobacter sp.]